MPQLTENMMFADRYLLLRQLGRGGTSEVWLAEQKLTGLKIAVKIYAPGIGLDNDGVEQFIKEFKLVFNFKHPNLLCPTNIDIQDRMPYLVMPYKERGSTLKLRGKFSEQDAWQFMHDVASGLHYLHNQNIIHQDIKPDNILIDDDGSFLITDFGISSEMRNTLPISAIDSINMTMAYAAPERWSARRLSVIPSDVWALGSSVYELLTGITPYGDLGGKMQYDGAEPPEPDEQWSPELTALIEQCLAKNVDARPSAAMIAEAAKPFAKGKPTTKETSLPQDKPTDKEKHKDQKTVRKEATPKTEGSAISKSARKSPKATKTTAKTPISTEKKNVVRRDNAEVKNTQRYNYVHRNVTGYQYQKKRDKSVIINRILYVVLTVFIFAVAGYFSYQYFDNKSVTIPIPVSIAEETAEIDSTTTPTVSEPSSKSNESDAKQTTSETSKPVDKLAARHTEQSETISANADKFLEDGHKYFNEGNYSKALENYRSYLMISQSDNSAVRQRIKTSEECLPLRSNADELYAQQKYVEAREQYIVIRRKNPVDKYARKQIELCIQKME
jgi:serine/threonine protein kinase